MGWIFTLGIFLLISRITAARRQILWPLVTMGSLCIIIVLSVLFTHPFLTITAAFGAWLSLSEANRGRKDGWTWKGKGFSDPQY